MAEKKLTTAERGKFKKIIHAALYKNDDLRELLIGNTTGKSAKEVRDMFKAHVQSHLFIEETLKDEASFIFYDVRIPEIHSHIKRCIVLMYAICHRSILEDYAKEGYYGDRSDAMSQMIEDALLNNNETPNEFGIGELKLIDVDIYNSSRFYGSVMTFEVPNFRVG